MIQKVCIVIPCLQELNNLRQCLSSIEIVLPKQQVMVIHMGDWEDHIILQHDLSIQIIKVNQVSAAKARNLGASFVQTDYLWFLDSDNWLVKKEFQSWQEELNKTISKKPNLIVLQRAESERSFKAGIEPNQWNFSRHCIEWNLIWETEHFLRLGRLDESCGSGSENLAQAGEVFTPLFKHFSSRKYRTVYLPNLEVGHPSLCKSVSRDRIFEYNYGSSYNAFKQIRQGLSLLTLYWFIKTLGGLLTDIKRGWAAKSSMLLVVARLLALWDAMLLISPRARTSNISQILDKIINREIK